MPDPRVDELTRRGLLGAAAVTAGGLALASCGGDSSSPKADKGPTAPTGPRKKGGTFRLGMSDSSSSDSVDAHLFLSFTSVAIVYNLYDTLTKYDRAEMKVVNSLAEEITPADDVSYWDVRLRDAQWHDGKPVTADDVIFSIKRILNPDTGASSAAFLATVDQKKLEKLDDKTVRIHLTTPDVSIPANLALSGSSIVPVGYDPKKPIGSGPFKFVSIDPGKLTVLERNENYWQPELPYLDRLEIVGFADPGTPRINALTSGQIDGVDHMDVSLVPTVEGKSSLQLIVSPSQGFNTFEMRPDAKPFDDVRVRQAIRLLADRAQIVEQALGGERFATVANDLGCPQDKYYKKDLPQREQDIEQAKSLLKEAGQENLKVTLTVSNLTAGILQTAQVLQQNAKAAGVTIEIENVTDVGTYFTKHYYQAPFKVNYYTTTDMFVYMKSAITSKGAYNIAGYSDPKVDKLLEEAQATLDEAEAKEALDEVQQTLWDSGAQAIFGFSKTAEAHSKKFVGFQTDILGYSLNQLRFADISTA